MGVFQQLSAESLHLKLDLDLGRLTARKIFIYGCYQQGEGARKLPRNFVDSFIEELDTGEM